MAEAVLLKFKKDPTKANPHKLEDYEVVFPKMYEKYNGRITVRFRHINAEIISKCYGMNEEGTYLDDWKVFAKCVKEIHGLEMLEAGENGEEVSVEMTVKDILSFEGMNVVSEEGDFAMGIIFAIVHNVAQTILAKSVLTEEEEKNLSRDAKHSTQDSSVSR